MERAVVPSMDREERLRCWIDAYSDAILRTCFLYLSDQAQAEDALQDTWVKAWRYMGEYERKGVQNDKAIKLYLKFGFNIISHYCFCRFETAAFVA